MWFNGTDDSGIDSSSNSKRKTLFSVLVVMILGVGIIIGTSLNQTIKNFFSSAASQPGSYGYGSFGDNNYQAGAGEFSCTLAYDKNINFQLAANSSCLLIPVPADYDGDGKLDMAVYRKSNGGWYVYGVNSGWLFGGDPTDIPVPGDYNGDGKAEAAVYRRSNSNWYVNGAPAGTGFGAPEDIPVPGDYDGDKKTDFAVFRPSNRHWYLMQSRDGYKDVQYGEAVTDIPVQADYDGDQKTDLAFFKTQTASYTWLVRPSGGTPQQIVMNFGETGDVPVPADFNGDNKADMAVFRPANSAWNFSDNLPALNWGEGSDIPVPGKYGPSGRAEVGVFRPRNSTWYPGGESNGIAFDTSNNSWPAKASPSPSVSASPSASPSPTASASSSPSPSASGVKAGDIVAPFGVVDIFDYNQVVTDFAKTGANLIADIDKNGSVDIFDYNIVVSNFGK